MTIRRTSYVLFSRFFFLIVLCGCGQALVNPAQPPTAQNAVSPLAENAAGPPLDVPGDPSFSEYLAINDLGEIAVDAGDGKPTTAYVARPPYHARDFKRESAPDSSLTTVTGVNNGGTVVGFFTNRRGDVTAFSERGGVWSHYAAGSNATKYLGVNDGGIAVGFDADSHGVKHAFSRDLKTGKLTRIHPGAQSVTATAIDDRGEIVGYIGEAKGSVKGFLWIAGRTIELSYPEAVETKPLGISPDGEIVGTYAGARGKSHGFLLRDATKTPQWHAFTEPNARGLTALTGINARGDIVGYYRNKVQHTTGFFCCPALRDTSVPPVIPAWGLGGDPQDTDPGAIPDQHLFAVIEDNGYVSNAKLAVNCPGVSSSSTCEPYKYVDFLYNSCNTPITLAAYQWADANDETGFDHVYPGAITLANRIEYDATPNPTGPNCKPDNANAVMRMNPGDSALNNYLYQNVWTGTNYKYDFPAPYGVMEDQAPIFAGIVVGGDGQVTTEYGSGTQPSGFANQVGNSPYADPTDWETALGIFVNGACAATCLNVAMNSAATGYGNAGNCSVVGNGHCHAQYQSGLIDNQADFDNICKTVSGGNLQYFQAERPIYAGRFGFEFLNSHTMTVEINTLANLYSHTSDGCASTKIATIEPSYGEGGLGDITGGYVVRLATLAYRWLVANPTTGMPDRVISMQLTEGQTLTEAPYFFEDTLVPAGAETSVPRYVWNGSKVTVGGGCPSTDGDSGGAVALLVQCVGSAGIYCQQYKHLYINQVDYGKTAACLNTSTSAENITSSWFANDPISSYSYVLSLQGGEMTSVPYQGVSGGSISMTTCTNKKYCTGQNTLSTQVAPFKGDGSDQLCGQCGVILLEDD